MSRLLRWLCDGGRRRGGDALAAAAVGLAAALAIVPAPAAAQDEPGVSFIVGLAYETGGPGPALVDALAIAGLDDVRPGSCHVTVCIEPTEHPFYFDEGLDLSFLLGLRYRLDAPVSFEALFSNGARGHAEGYEGAEFDHLVVSYTSFMLTTSVGAHLGPVRFEAGPVFNRIGWKSVFNSVQEVQDVSLVVGGLAGASASFAFKDVVLALRVGARRFPNTDIENPARIALSADYSSYYVGVSASTLIR